MAFALRKLAMKLLFFQIPAPIVEVVFNLTPDLNQVAPAGKVAHFDCSWDDWKYSLLHKKGATMPYYARRIEDI